MKISDINYSPLEQLKKAQTTAYKQLFTRKKYLIILTLITLLVIPLGIYIDPIFLWVLPTVIAVWTASIGSKIKKLSWQRFASINGWQLQPADMSLLPYGLQNMGRSPTMSEVIIANFDNLNCKLFSFEYTTGSGKHSRLHVFTVVRFDLGEPFPHIVLDGDNNNKLNIFGKYQRIKLEGDFNKFFKLHVAPGQHIDVLSIITPDVMQTLINANQKQDIEFYNQGLYFIGINEQRNPESFKILLDSVKRLSAEIIHKAKSLNYKPESSVKQV